MSTTELKPKENENRNKLKEEKPLVYEKIVKFDEKFRRGESIDLSCLGLKKYQGV